jgi:transcriptional regulator with XRE-family HTH domain
MNKFGDLIRAQREENEMILRHLAAQLDVDTAYLSKMERGERRAKREQVLQLVKIFKLDHDSTMALWLADQVFELVADDKQAFQALKLAEKELREKMANV